jgi:hypothetical protein
MLKCTVSIFLYFGLFLFFLFVPRFVSFLCPNAPRLFWEVELFLIPFEVLCYKLEGRRFESNRTVALGSTDPLTEMSTRNLPWGGGGVKGGRRVRLTTLPPYGLLH